MKLKLVKMIKNFGKILELLGDRLEVCVSVYKKETLYKSTSGSALSV